MFHGSRRIGRARSVKKHTPKMPFSFKRQILPPLAGIFIMLIFFVGLNSQRIAAEMTYRLNSDKITISPSAKEPVNQPVIVPDDASQLVIPKINVNAPLILEPSYSEQKVQLALRDGVVLYGQTAKPGQIGNSVILGHSSGQIWAPGKYKYVFTLLDKVKQNDQITIDYKGTRYIYSVTNSEIITPTNLSILNQNSSTPNLTLVTCVPVGTSKYRLVVHAVQISPKPVANTPPKLRPAVKAESQLPGSAQNSIWRSLFGWL